MVRYIYSLRLKRYGTLKILPLPRPPSSSEPFHCHGHSSKGLKVRSVRGSSRQHKKDAVGHPLQVIVTGGLLRYLPAHCQQLHTLHPGSGAGCVGLRRPGGEVEQRLLGAWCANSASHLRHHPVDLHEAWLGHGGHCLTAACPDRRLGAVAAAQAQPSARGAWSSTSIALANATRTWGLTPIRAGWNGKPHYAAWSTCSLPAR